MIARLPIRSCGRHGGSSSHRTQARKAALGQLATRIERKHLLEGMSLLGARFGDGGEHQPNLRQIRLLGGQST